MVAPSCTKHVCSIGKVKAIGFGRIATQVGKYRGEKEILLWYKTSPFTIISTLRFYNIPTSFKSTFSSFRFQIEKNFQCKDIVR